MLTGAEVWEITRWYRSNWEPVVLDEKSRILITQIEKQMEEVPVTGDDNYRTIWLWDKRGSAEAFRESYENTEEKDLTDEEVRERFESDFPDEELWFRFSTGNYREHKTYKLGRDYLLYTAPDAEGWEQDHSEILEWISSRLEVSTDLLRRGEYHSFVTEHIPKKYRMGTIQRKALWSIMPEYREWDLGNLTEDQISRYCEHAPDLYDPLITGERLQKMSLNKYREICVLGYRENRYEHWDEWSAEKLFSRYSDERNGGLTELEPDSEKDFDDWYAVKDKWTIYNPSHLWEAVQGSSRTRIHLYVSRDEHGYYLSLSGCTAYMADELALWYLALTDHGIGVHFYEYEEVRRLLLGEDLVGIVGVEKEPYYYAHGGFPGPDVGSCISYPEEGDTEKLDELTDWLDI